MEVRQIEPIDRAELRATIQKWIDAHTDVDDTDGVGLLEDVLWEINAQPTLTPPNEWVSVKERLPDNHGEYIVCACDEGEPIDERIWGDTVVICADYYDGTFTWYEGNTEYDISDIVTHWMPLPEAPDSRPPEGREEAVRH